LNSLSVSGHAKLRIICVDYNAKRYGLSRKLLHGFERKLVALLVFVFGDSSNTNMSINNIQTPEASPGNSALASPYTDKRGYAKRWQGSTRWVDDLIARGLPHLKIGKRRVRLCIADADAWMQEQFRTQRRAVKGA
jgi:hypothetical protein